MMKKFFFLGFIVILTIVSIFVGPKIIKSKSFARFLNFIEFRDPRIFDAVYYPNANFHTIAAATDHNEALECLVESIKDKNMSLQVLGLGRRWTGFGVKSQWISWYLDKQKLADTDILLVIDAYDVIVLANEQEIKERFLMFNSPIVFSTEKICWPDATLASQYPNTNSTYKYLNAGTYIGYVGAIKEALKEMNLRDRDDDQLAFTKYFLAHPEKIALDYQCELFWPLSGVDPAAIEIMEGETMNRVKNLETGSMPSILHGNGPSKKLLFETYYNKLRKSKS